MNLCDECRFRPVCGKAAAVAPVKIKDCGDFKGAGMNPARTKKEDGHG